MMMIPSIEEIVYGLISGKFTEEQAIEWLHQHADKDNPELRDGFAGLAMHAELNTAGSFEAPRDALVAAAHKAGRGVDQQIAFNAYEVADAMLAERNKP